MIANLKLIAILGGLLFLSVAANLFAIYRFGKAEAAAEAANEIATLEAEKTSLERTVAVNAALASRAAEDNAALLTDLQAIADRGQQTRVVYRRAAAAAPLGGACAPGSERVQAVNAALGEQP